MDIKKDIENRIDFIKKMLKDSGAKGIVYGNSGGKDSVLVGILCRAACENVLGIIMPCGSKQNYTTDTEHAKAVSEQYNIDCKIIDLGGVKNALTGSIKAGTAEDISKESESNIAPRLRMTVLYAIARDKNYLVAGTGNKSEIYMGYFTKWGDGACDFNPIADLTVTEIYSMLKYLKAPQFIIDKPPSAGLYDGQTDEKEMGVSYLEIDGFILQGKKGGNYALIEKNHKFSEHKRMPPKFYENNKNN